ncbi:16677_t:CDS:10 [Cetraspora pellucida]|uniref:16677_t:CDS:1 n=1 Tax=Cetraspora pellucida TaxID=1433469 RepID=A0A9N9BUS2_9GLOM|nr:16677_t:CDS:10 [Cetraspora pellucida]
MQRYIVASQINVAPSVGQVAGREEAFGLVILCLASPALNWYNICIKGVATLTAVQAIGTRNGGNQIGGLNTAGEFCNKARAEIGRIRAGVTTDANIILNRTWNKDWSIAGGKPTDNAPVAPNAGGGFLAITIAPGIKLRQLLYLFSTSYMMVEHLKQMAVFGQLMQRDMSVEEFSTRIKKENITRALAKAEKFTLSQRNAPSSLPAFLVANPYIDTNKSGMTKTEIVDLIKTAMASSESQTTQQNADLQSTIKSLQETMSQVTKTLDNSKKSSKKRAKDTAINCFLSNLLRKNPVKHSVDEYDYDPIEDISDSLARLTLNSVIKTAVTNAPSVEDLDIIPETAFERRKREVKKSKKSKVNINTVDLNLDSGTSSDTFSNSSDFDTSSENSSDSEEETIRKVLQSELKLIFPDHFSQDSIKANIPNQVVSLDPDKKEDLDGLIEIDFVKKKEQKTSVATIKCKIKCLKISVMTVNSGAEPLIITENIVKCVGAKIDKSETHNLSGIATVLVESVGVVHKLPITLALGCTIHEDFIVVKYQKLMLIFSNQLLKKYNSTLDWKTNELKISFNEKNYIIPVTMHKVKNKLEINCTNITPDCDDFSTLNNISQDSQGLSEYDDLLLLRYDFFQLKQLDHMRCLVRNFGRSFWLKSQRDPPGSMNSENEGVLDELDNLLGLFSEGGTDETDSECHAKSEKVKSLQSVINLLPLEYFDKNNQPDGPKRTDSYIKSSSKKNNEPESSSTSSEQIIPTTISKEKISLGSMRNSIDIDKLLSSNLESIMPKEKVKYPIHQKYINREEANIIFSKSLSGFIKTFST